MNKTVVWLVPDLIKGSGGHRTILQHAYHMSINGWYVILYLESVTEKKNESYGQLIERLFGYKFDDVRLGWEQLEKADLYFATIWYSAKIVRDIAYRSEKYYFVQDYEACFNPMGDAYLLAENSYRYGLKCITIGRWLSFKINSNFNAEVGFFDFCADKSVYKPLRKLEERELSICFIYQPEKPRRCVNIGLDALQIVKHHRPDVKIYLFGSNANKPLGLDCENLGLISLKECNELYNTCSLGLCLSASNPSRIPFEMMAAGLPVVEFWRENNLYDLPDSSTLLCDPTPESLAKGMLSLLSDKETREEMSKSGVAYMSERGLDSGLKQFLSIIDAKVKPFVEYSAIYKRAPVVDVNFELSVPEIKSLRNFSYFKRKYKKYFPPLIVRVLKKLNSKLKGM